MNDETNGLKKLVEKKARQHGKFILASGIEATRYFDLKQVLLDPEGANLIGNIMFESIKGMGVEAVGGYGLGAGLITSSIVLKSKLLKKPIYGFEVIEREKLDEDDPQRYEDETETYVIKGNLPLVGSKVAIVDDVISTGAAIFRAIGIIEGKGYKVAKVRAILDRQLGGSKELQRKGYDFRAILRADAFGKIYINK